MSLYSYFDFATLAVVKKEREKGGKKRKKLSVLTKQTHGTEGKAEEQAGYSWYLEPRNVYFQFMNEQHLDSLEVLGLCEC